MGSTVPLVRPRPEYVRLRLGVRVLGLAVKGLVRVLVWLARRPVGVAVTTAAVTAGVNSYEVNRWAPAVLALLVGGLLVAWRWWHPGSFRRWVEWPWRAFWRRIFVYAVHWPAAMQSTGLTDRITGEERFPKIVRVRRRGCVDEVTVKTLPGQVLEDYSEVAHRLAAIFEAVDCRVRSHRRSRRRLRLWFLVADPLADPVPLLDVPESPDLAALPVAVQEDGSTWCLRLLGTHVLVVGATGSGKGSVIWSVLRAMGPLIAQRLVEVWAIDPKGGMELYPGRRLFTRFCYGDLKTGDPDAAHGYAASFADFLDDAVATTLARQARMRGHTRQHTPAPGDPAIVVLIDELAALTAYLTDRDIRRRIHAALGLLWSQGRAVGVYLVSAVQDARKDIIPDRGLIPTRIALRTNEPEETDLALGSGARKRGARCHDISPATPGIAYVVVDGVPEPVRVRFAYIDDNEIATVAALYDPVRASVETPPAIEGVDR